MIKLMAIKSYGDFQPRPRQSPSLDPLEGLVLDPLEGLVLDPLEGLVLDLLVGLGPDLPLEAGTVRPGGCTVDLLLSVPGRTGGQGAGAGGQGGGAGGTTGGRGRVVDTRRPGGRELVLPGGDMAVAVSLSRHGPGGKLLLF